jgi:hypothetical protein
VGVEFPTLRTSTFETCPRIFSVYFFASCETKRLFSLQFFWQVLASVIGRASHGFSVGVFQSHLKVLATWPCFAGGGVQKKKLDWEFS